ncbi:hypothetical protein [Ramlibacter pallidus]|uniref:Uncharacterized protein n=1 Tax=Ramlibacter pallidus TaxID=2780087 RepID=A0ABR9S289_9BURK|nr:hypothetical protein [Ramlibacter pallidus]MBE7367618.1 hypothetical protein [Ramlibacter pallidus]
MQPASEHRFSLADCLRELAIAAIPLLAALALTACAADVPDTEATATASLSQRSPR